MKQYINVQNNSLPLTLEIGTDTVFERSNLHTIERDGETIYEYDEKQYTMQEYLRDTLPQLELAIAELSALIGGGANV